MLVLEAWHDLGADRQIGFGVLGCIPHAAIVRWAEWNGLDRENTMLLIRVIRQLDAERVQREESKRRLKGEA